MAFKREIFGYVNADGENVYVDPSRAAKLLTLHCRGNVHEFVKLAQSPDPSIAKEAMSFIIAGVCDAFDVQAFDKKTGQGYLESELLDLLNLFYAWRQKKNPSTGSGPTSPPSTDSPSSPPGSGPKAGPSTSMSGTASG